MRKAFTLVELLIVIAIIAILAAIAIPQFSKYKQRAYVAAMQSDAHNIIAAEEAYYTEKDTYGDPASVYPQNKLTKNVSYASHGTGNCSDGSPGYYFSLQHTNIKDKYVVFQSCVDKAPRESNSKVSSADDNSTSSSSGNGTTSDNGTSDNGTKG
jgi:type IV pilus assembly protein PilA